MTVPGQVSGEYPKLICSLSKLTPHTVDGRNSVPWLKPCLVGICSSRVSQAVQELFHPQHATDSGLIRQGSEPLPARSPNSL